MKNLLYIIFTILIQIQFIKAQCYTDCSGSNTVVGLEAGFSFEFGATSNSFLGLRAGHKNTDGGANSFVGSSAGYSTTDGSANSFFGASAGYWNTTGDGNTYIGSYAGQYVRGSNNIMIGSSTGPTSISTGTFSNLLFIDNQRTNTPLIYGDFSTDFVKINGTLQTESFEVLTGLNNPSSIDLKENLKAINSKLILNQLMQLPILSWNYKTQPDVSHIGPTSERFNELFNIKGGNLKSISTIDADGIALAAIQALKFENNQIQLDNACLRQQNEEIEKALIDLTKRMILLEKSN